MNNDLLMIIRQIMSQTDLPQEVFIEAIEAALYSAAKRRYGSTRGVSIKIDYELGNIKCYVPKKVVEIMHHFAKEIPVEEALKIKSDAQLDEIIEVEVDPREFGRIEAQTARQILAQKIKEAERDQIYQEYKAQEGEVITGYFQRIERGNLIIDLERTEGLLPFSEAPRPHDYRRGDALKCLILEVEVNLKGPQIILSRTHNGLIARLFEMEVPEVYDGLVRIMAIARDPGDRAKVAVVSTEEGIDAVGTCVGVKGSRVQTVVRELEGEKIDLLAWHADPAIFIANALQPATVVRVNVDEKNKNAEVIVPDDQLSLAIGRRGQNARLAAKLTSWKIDIKSESEVETQFKEEITEELFKPASSETDTPSSHPINESDSDAPQTLPLPHADEVDLTELGGVGAKTAELLRDAGLPTVESIAQATLEELCSAPGIGTKTAEKIHHAALEMLSASGA